MVMRFDPSSKRAWMPSYLWAQIASWTLKRLSVSVTRSCIFNFQKNTKKRPPRLPAGGAVNSHPELFNASVEFAPAYHEAPPAAVDLLIDKKSALTLPLVLDNVWLAAVTEPIVRSLVDSPLAFQLVNVLVVAAVNKIDVAPVLL